MSDSDSSIHITQSSFQIPEVPRAPPVSGPPPHITGEAIPDQGETELIVPVELWTENHRNERGDPCDGCPLCLQSPELSLKVQTFQHRAREYQRWTARVEAEEKRIASEHQRREATRNADRLPVEQELNKKKAGKIAAYKGYRELLNENTKNIQQQYKDETSTLRIKLRRDLLEATEAYNDGIRSLEETYQTTIDKLREQLETLQNEQRQARESFQSAAKTELELLQRRAFNSQLEFEQLRKELQAVCPHPSLEDLKSILQRWPVQQSHPQRGTIRCRVCHKIFTLEQITENVRRGGSTLAYSPTPTDCPGGGAGPHGPLGSGPTRPASGSASSSCDSGVSSPKRARSESRRNSPEHGDQRSPKRARQEAGAHTGPEGTLPRDPSPCNPDPSGEETPGRRSPRRGAGGDREHGSVGSPEDFEGL